jgi:hypothetical protein
LFTDKARGLEADSGRVLFQLKRLLAREFSFLNGNQPFPPRPQAVKLLRAMPM